MRFTVLCTLLGLCAFSLRLPLFETVAGILLMSPVAFFLAGSYFEPSRNLYLLVIVAVTALVAALRALKRAPKDALYDLKEELIPVAVFFVCFTIWHALCMCWPDFISIGERLRDYALLSSVINSPIRVQEPWYTFVALNYYAYWYRVGHMLSSVLALNTWDVYHLLQSFTYALYATCAFQILHRHLKFSLYGAAMSAALVVIGSNVAGAFSVAFGFLFPPYNWLALKLTGNPVPVPDQNQNPWFDNNWWGPSRVVEGAINEFPAWSFVLGDLHPHYLNLPLIPFFVVVLLALCAAKLTDQEKIIAALSLTIVPILWIYGSNVWEVPVWGAFAATLILYFTSFKKRIKTYFSKRNFCIYWVLAVVLITLVTCYALYASSRNIKPMDYPFSFVRWPIKRTPLAEFARHWGFPLCLMAWSLIVLLRERAQRVFITLLLVSLFIFQEALPCLLVLLAAVLWRAYIMLREFHARDEHGSAAILVIEALGVVALGTIIVPEIVYLNDPYGDEIDRMNTIFKFYSAAWIFMHLFAFYLVREAWQELAANFAKNWLPLAAPAAALLFFGFFFVRTAALHRPTGEVIAGTASEGLSSIEREFPGGARTVQTLRGMPKGTVLEAQGDAYSYTSFVSTLSGNFAYLGWANHIGLLYPLHQEVSARERATREFYLEADCEKKLEFLKREEISYAVLGILEKRKYPEINPSSFECLKNIFSEGEYRLYSP